MEAHRRKNADVYWMRRSILEDLAWHHRGRRRHLQAMSGDHEEGEEMKNPFPGKLAWDRCQLGGTDIWLFGGNCTLKQAKFILHAVRQHDELVAMLREHEFGGDAENGDACCPECRCIPAQSGQGHYADCGYAALLAEE